MPKNSKIKEPKVNVEKMTAEIDLTENCLIVVADGKPKTIEGPPTGFGESKAIWKEGKVIDVIKSERVRI